MNGVSTPGSEWLIYKQASLKTTQRVRKTAQTAKTQACSPGRRLLSPGSALLGDSWSLQAFVACAVRGELRAVNICPAPSTASCSGCS